MNEIYEKMIMSANDNDLQIDENLISKFNILDLYGKETLEDIQEKISKATGLAFVTVDYSGEPITKMTSFTAFCNEIRKKEDGACGCKSSDAFGGIQAAITKKNCVYFCPCGLFEIAIPIIVRGHYLGAFIGGQVRCLDAPSGVTKLETVIETSKKYKEDKHMQELFSSTPIYKYEKFINVAELIVLILNQLGERQAYRVIQNDSLKKQMEEIRSYTKQLEIENNFKENELTNLKAELNPYFFINVLSSISNLAVIEDSPKTHEMIVMVSEFVRQSICNEKRYISLYEEFENVEKYLKIQKVKYGELLQYSIEIPKNMHGQKIPSNILMPFVENAVFYGISTKVEGGKVEIKALYDKDDVVISISDDGMGFNDEIIAEKYKIFKGNYEGEYIQISIANARKKLITLFGDKYDPLIETVENEGTKIVINYPKRFKERNA
jgi:two-component system LytT family sensor kinase